MCKVIAVANSKGGVGKTTSAANLGFGLAKKGKKVLMIDLDPQGNLSQSLGIKEPDELECSLVSVLEKVINNKVINDKEALFHHEEGLDLIPGNIELSGLENMLERVIAREKILGAYLEQVKQNYDYVIIDCMPSLSKLTFNALCCADTILIPVQAAYLPMRGLQQLIQTIANAKRWINPKLEIEGVLITMVDTRCNNTKEIIEKVRQAYGNYVCIFDTFIPKSVRLEEVAATGMSIYTYAPKSKPALAYEALTEEVLSHEKI